MVSPSIVKPGRAYDCLKLLLALTCPNPFAQEPQKCLATVRGGLVPGMFVQEWPPDK